MPEIEVERTICAPLDTVYALAKDIERFPEFMDDVEEVVVLERQGSRTISRWVGVVKQFNRKIEWTERDEWDDEAHVCRFAQVEGDYSKYEGVWSFEEAQGKTRVKLRIEVEIDVPLIGPLLKTVIARLVRANCERMLDGLAREAEAAAEGG